MKHVRMFPIALLIAVPAFAQWSTDSTVNNAISTAVSDQQFPAIASDGAGGAIITWPDFRNGNWDIYAQRINSSGAVQWDTNGVAICTTTDLQDFPSIVSDGVGGAIITWHDYRNVPSWAPDIYAQRINATGIVQWTPNGVSICTDSVGQSYPKIVSDGAGGAVITWGDSRNGPNGDIYVQRISATGVTQWTANGVAICIATGVQTDHTIASDGAGGAIITWEDWRSGVYGPADIYVQRIDASGVVQWTFNGVAICAATDHQFEPTITSDGAGGAIITWYDTRSVIADIYAQRINASGVEQWTPDGVAICTATNSQQGPIIVSSGAGGAIIAWRDGRSVTSPDIYAQSINASGVVQWTPEGVAICTEYGPQDQPTIVSDGAGGAIIAWRDYRSGTNGDIYAQRVNATGVVQWDSNGAAISVAAGFQLSPSITSDSLGGAIITWHDGRNYPTTSYDIYAQQVSANGNLGEITDVIETGGLPSAFMLHQNYANPFNPTTRIQFSLPHSTFVTLKVYDLLGEEVATLVEENMNPGRYEVMWNASGRASGVYFYRLRAGDFVGTKKLIILK